MVRPVVPVKRHQISGDFCKNVENKVAKRIQDRRIILEDDNIIPDAGAPFCGESISLYSEGIMCIGALTAFLSV